MGDRPGREALSIHQADLLLHGWDLAEATHQDATIDPDLAGFALETERWFVQPQMRGPGRAVRRGVADRRDRLGAGAAACLQRPSGRLARRPGTSWVSGRLICCIRLVQATSADELMIAF